MVAELDPVTGLESVAVGPPGERVEPVAVSGIPPPIELEVEFAPAGVGDPEGAPLDKLLEPALVPLEPLSLTEEAPPATPVSEFEFEFEPAAVSVLEDAVDFVLRACGALVPVAMGLPREVVVRSSMISPRVGCTGSEMI